MFYLYIYMYTYIHLYLYRNICLFACLCFLLFDKVGLNPLVRWVRGPMHTDPTRRPDRPRPDHVKPFCQTDPTMSIKLCTTQCDA